MRASFIHQLHFIHSFEEGERAKRARHILEHYYKQRILSAKLDTMKNKLPTIGLPGGYEDTKTAYDRVGSPSYLGYLTLALIGIGILAFTRIILSL